MAIFNSELLVYQRVSNRKMCWFPKCPICGYPLHHPVVNHDFVQVNNLQLTTGAPSLVSAMHEKPFKCWELLAMVWFPEGMVCPWACSFTTLCAFVFYISLAMFTFHLWAISRLIFRWVVDLFSENDRKTRSIQGEHFKAFSGKLW